MNGHLRVLVYRGEVVESAHRVHAAVVDGEGRLLRAAGDPAVIVFPRSAAKPFQAAAVVAAGAAAAFGFTEAELALACASHAGKPGHVEGVAAVLRRLGLQAQDLECGLQPGRPTPLHHNCSGKHAALLALARHRGWPAAGYTALTHPVQREVAAAVAAAAGMAEEELVPAVDGCSVPTFALPLHRLALAFARLAAAPAACGDQALAAALARVRAAMASHPEMVAGEGLFDTDLGRVTGGRIVGKSGAEGVFAAAVTAPPVGLALKVEDGAARAVAPAAVALLRRLGFLSPSEAEALAPHGRPVVYNHRGLAVGHVAAGDFMPA